MINQMRRRQTRDRYINLPYLRGISSAGRAQTSWQHLRYSTSCVIPMQDSDVCLLRQKKQTKEIFIFPCRRAQCDPKIEIRQKKTESSSSLIGIVANDY